MREHEKEIVNGWRVTDYLLIQMLSRAKTFSKKKMEKMNQVILGQQRQISKQAKCINPITDLNPVRKKR